MRFDVNDDVTITMRIIKGIGIRHWHFHILTVPDQDIKMQYQYRVFWILALRVSTTSAFIRPISLLIGPYPAPGPSRFALTLPLFFNPTFPQLRLVLCSLHCSRIPKQTNVHHVIPVRENVWPGNGFNSYDCRSSGRPSAQSLRQVEMHPRQ